MIQDRDYIVCIDDKLLSIPQIDKICTVLKEKFGRLLEDNKRLSEENEKLKSGIWEKEEMARLKSEYERMSKDYYRGFPISEDEWTRICGWQKWQNPNIELVTNNNTFSYKFTPTPIGVSGKCVAPNGDEFEFQTIG